MRRAFDEKNFRNNMQDFVYNTFLPRAGRTPKKDGQKDGQTGTGVLTRTRPKPEKPAMYRVVLLNDDYTPMDFVVYVLERFFSKTQAEATDIMLSVHRTGVGTCGIYTHEIAETKVNLVLDCARKNEHPLQCTMEKE